MFRDILLYKFNADTHINAFTILCVQGMFAADDFR